MRSLNSALFNIAHAYSRAGDDMASLAHLQDADFAAPAIMCKSFAIELLLKFFLVIPHPTAQTTADLGAFGVDLHGHKYTELYDRMIPTYQHRIATSFSQTTGKVTNATEFRTVLIALGNDPFVFWRYIYEKTGWHTLDFRLLDYVLLALGKAAEVERMRLAATPL